LDIRSAEEVLKEILEGYNRRPNEWQIALDYLGNSLFFGPGKGYMIKSMMIGPQENLGVGVRLEDAEGLRGALAPTAPSGLRPMGMDLAQKVLSERSLDGEVASRGQLISKILSIDPVPTWELGREGVGGIVEGPYTAHPDLGAISKSQHELNLRLNRELQALFMARFPMRASMFR
jgi:hypothetical protein